LNTKSDPVTCGEGIKAYVKANALMNYATNRKINCTLCAETLIMMTRQMNVHLLMNVKA